MMTRTISDNAALTALLRTFINVEGRLEAAVALVEESGGKLLEAPHSMGPHGSRAIILDTEGNRVALHSRG